MNLNYREYISIHLCYYMYLFLFLGYIMYRVTPKQNQHYTQHI